MISEIYSLENQALVDAVTAEHQLIEKLKASGMTFEQIAELADNGSDNKGRLDFFNED